jgi:hypothetical protein
VLEPDEVAELAGVAVVVDDDESDFEESGLDVSDLVPRLSVL